MNREEIEKGIVFDENEQEVSPLSDDYEYYKHEQENRSNPLSDDYCKYDWD